MHHLNLAFTLLKRDWRAGEMRLLVMALLIAVTAVTTVSFFANRMQRALSDQAAELIGADLLLIADHSLLQSFKNKAQELKLQQTSLVLFPSTVSKSDAVQLVELKAVEAGYPLRGKLKIADSSSAARETTDIPKPGTVWIDERLQNRLNLKIGDTIDVGLKKFTIAALLTWEPDNAVSLFNVAPRLMMNLADIPATGLIQNGSRVSYRLLVGGKESDIDQYRAWAKNNLGRGERIEGVRDARPEIRSALERAETFLGLAALVSVILAGIVIALASWRHRERHLDSAAVMRCLGAAQDMILKLYALQFLIVGLLGSLLACLFGYLAHEILLRQFSGIVQGTLPAPSLVPVLEGVATGMILLFGFALPPLLRLRNVPALRVIRRELGTIKGADAIAYIAGLGTVILLLFWKATDLKLGAYVIGGLILLVAMCSGLALLLIYLLRRYREHANATWCFSLAALSRHTQSTIVQIVSLGLGIMVLLLLTLVRADLLESWRTTLPKDAPNRFIIGIQPDQIAPMKKFFSDRKYPVPELFPMVRGRLVMINDKNVSGADYADDRAKRLVEREFNLSWGEILPTHNTIVSGKWWDKNNKDIEQLSVEQGIAETLGIKLGNMLTYEVVGSRFSAKVTSLRKLDWDSFRVNFFVISPPGLLDRYPASYITSFHLPAEQNALIGELIRAFPNFTIIDVAAIMEQVRGLMEKVAGAVQFIFLFTLAAGLLILYAAIVTTQEQRISETAILRALGAKKQQLMRAQIVEFAIIGALTGLIGAFGASVLSFILSKQLLHIPYHFNAWVWLVGLIAGMVGVTLAGLLATRQTLNHPPLQVLRAAD
jgi:putative ABC transport system permease protein